MTNRRIPLIRYAVTVERHTVQRWIVEARQSTTVAADPGQAREIAVWESHAKAGIPPWKPCVRRSLKYATAVRAGASSPRRLSEVPRERIAA